MKTSNKILLTAFILIIIVGIAAAAFMKAAIFGEYTQGDGNVVKEDRTSETFSKIDVSGNFHVLFTQDSISRIELTTDSNLMEYVVTEVSGEELKIFTSSKIKPTQLRLDISSQDIREIKSSAGAHFDGQNLITTPELSIRGSAGAEINLEAIVEKLLVELSAGSHATLSGEADEAEYEGSAGSHLEAYEMQAKDVSASASSGAQLNVNATENLSVDGSSGGSIYYAGTPYLNEINLSSGAAVHQRKD